MNIPRIVDATVILMMTLSLAALEGSAEEKA